MGRSASFANIALLSAAMLAPHIAYGAPPSIMSPTDKRALDLFEQSAQDYREGRFQEAVEKLLEARKVKREPVLLYNLARAYEALGRWEEAAKAYEQYLVEEPTASDRKAIEGRVLTLNEHAAALAAARKSDTKEIREPEPVKTDPPPGQRERVVTTAVPWFVAGAGVVVVGTAVGLGAVASSKHDDAVSEPTQRKAVELQESAETLARVATVMIIAGAVVALSGLAWGILRTTQTTSALAGTRAAKIGPGFATWTFR